ncbi:MAG TPA: hypothetical protein VNJ08_10985 [Bacteriovoracaceae bacterium]|nr:hypothetical protein [Bacteriovoracaceae bacterium]
MKFIFLIMMTTFASYAHAFFKPWNGHSNPLIMSTGLERNFSSLPLAGIALGPKKYWSSYYWPLSRGNINLRWNTPNPIGFELDSPDMEQAQRMQISELASLAPSEKYDLFTGRYSYPLRRKVEKKVSPRISEWQGICHGWAAATLNHDEPEPEIVTNPDGIRIPFGSSDIKALLSYYYAFHNDPISTHQMGLRYNGRRYCNEDLNAGAFHIVLSNKLGLGGNGFVADIDNGREVWNHVVYNYRSSILENNLPPSEDSARGTMKVVRIKTNMKVVFNIVQNSWLPVIDTNLQVYKDLDYEYDLDLNGQGNIIGREWRSSLRPDFLWRVEPAKSFTGLFSRLGELL